jgi:hypothetical protein
MRLAQCAPRAARLRKAPALEPLELLCHRPLDDHSEIATRNLRAHQGPKPLELVLELGARSELTLAGMAGGSIRAGRAGGTEWAGGGALPTTRRQRDSGPRPPPRQRESAHQLRLDRVAASGSPGRQERRGGGSGSFLSPAHPAWRDLRSALRSGVGLVRRVEALGSPESSAGQPRDPVRWRRPSASMSRSIGCSREARATVIRA